MNWTNLAAVAVVVWVVWSMRPVWAAVGKGLWQFVKLTSPIWATFVCLCLVLALGFGACWCIDHTVGWFSGVNSAVRRVEAVEKSLNTPKDVCFHITPTGWESCGITYGPDGVVGCRRIGGSATAKEVYLRLSSRLDALDRRVDRKMDVPPPTTNSIICTSNRWSSIQVATNGMTLNPELLEAIRVYIEKARTP